MRPSQRRDRSRGGMMLVLVVLLLFVLSAFLAVTAAMLSRSWRTSRRFHQRDQVRQAAQAALAMGMARAARSGDDAFELAGTHGETTYQVAGRPLGTDGFFLQISAAREGIAPARVEAELRLVEGDGGARQWQIVSYREGLRVSGEPAPTDEAGP